MNPSAGSPLRSLLYVLAFMTVVVIGSTGAYMVAGWSFGDALYMVLLTVYTVGYGEVRPIDTTYLHVVTIGTIVLGCTGMILVTGTLVQLLTFAEVQRLLGGNRVKSDIDKLNGHVIICGFGRIGVRLAKDLATGGADFVVVEREESRIAEARDLGYLYLHGDATDETALNAAGVQRAEVLATVLPSDAANVFITLSARGLNPDIKIIARGEEPSTERKLLQAGADQVVLPTHIGAERIAEMVLFPETSQFVGGSERMVKFDSVLRDLGLELEVATVGANTAAAGLTVNTLEERGKGAFFVVQITRADGEIISRPASDEPIQVGDGLLVVGRHGGRIKSIFSAKAERARAGRTTY